MMVSDTFKMEYTILRVSVLILVLVDDGLWLLNLYFFWQQSREVLILVLVDDGLWRKTETLVITKQ